MKSKFGSECPVCDKFINKGDNIAQLKEPIRVYGWYDFGMRKGEKYSNLVRWAHLKCAREKNK